MLLRPSTVSSVLLFFYSRRTECRAVFNRNANNLVRTCTNLLCILGTVLIFFLRVYIIFNTKKVVYMCIRNICEDRHKRREQRIIIGGYQTKLLHLFLSLIYASFTRFHYKISVKSISSRSTYLRVFRILRTIFLSKNLFL